MSRSDVPDEAKEPIHFREPLEGWLSPEHGNDGDYPLVFIVAPEESPSQVLLGRKRRGFGKNKYVRRDRV